MDVGEKIKAARLAKGLTQEELGKIIGVQKSAIAKYEAGRVVNIKRQTIKKLAVALDIRGSDLIESDEHQVEDYIDLTPSQVETWIENSATPEQAAEIAVAIAKRLNHEGKIKMLQSLVAELNE